MSGVWGFQREEPKSSLKKRNKHQMKRKRSLMKRTEEEGNKGKGEAAPGLWEPWNFVSYIKRRGCQQSNRQTEKERRARQMSKIKVTSKQTPDTQRGAALESGVLRGTTSPFLHLRSSQDPGLTTWESGRVRGHLERRVIHSFHKEVGSEACREDPLSREWS